MRHFFLGLLMTICVGSAQAEPIPGANDVVLSRAAQNWLEGNDPNAALWEIGTIANAGNLAAQDLLNKIFARFVRLDYPDLAPEQYHTLIPEVPEDIRNDRFPYAIDWNSVPMASIIRSLGGPDSAEDWIKNAEIVRNAGFAELWEERVISEIRNGTREIEVIEYASTHSDGFPRLKRRIWITRGLEAGLREKLTYIDPDRLEKRIARWNGPAWDTQTSDNFALALAERRWPAIDAAQELIAINKALPDDRTVPAATMALIDILQAMRDDSEDPPSADEIALLSDMLVAEAEFDLRLRPIIETCRKVCASEVSNCIPNIVLSQPIIPQADLSPVIARADFFGSERSAQDYLAFFGSMHRAPVLTNIKIPQCFSDAASAAR